MVPSSAGLVGVSLSTTNRVLTSVALDLLQEMYAKLMDKSSTEAEAHVKTLYDSYYAKYMAETQAAADEMEGIATKG